VVAWLTSLVLLDNRIRMRESGQNLRRSRPAA